MTTDTAAAPAPSTPEPASPVTAGGAPPFNGVPIAEAMAQAEETLAVDRKLPGFEPPPYDAAGWNRKIASKNRGVASAHTAWELARDKAANAKKILDRESKELSDLIVAMDTERKYAEGELVQPTLRAVSQGVASSSCRYEQVEGKPCPGCILLRESGAPLPDPEDTDHATIVREALEGAEDREVLYADLEFDNIAITAETVTGWTDEQAREVSLWLGLNANLPTDANQIPTPKVLASPAPAEPAATDAEVMADAKICLCQTPDFVVPADKDSEADARCSKCDGVPTGDQPKVVKFAKRAKGKR